MPNLFHRLGDATTRHAARVAFAVGAYTGRYPLPSPQQELNMAAIDDLNTAVSNVQTYVGTLQSDLANADMTPQVEAATAALNALVPAPVVAPVVEPAPVADTTITTAPVLDLNPNAAAS